MLPPRSDDEWKALTDQVNIDSARKSGEKKFEQLGAEEIEYLRHRAATDLFFLAYGILGYSRLSPGLHGNICSWLQRTASEQYRMVLMPRAHFKTSLVTISDSIQCVLPNSSAPWPRNLGPNCRILFGHESHEGATRFLYETTRHFCNNPRLMGLFPELVPNSRIQRINKQELELPREEHWAEPTFDTIGVGGHNQGKHWNLLKLDDIFGDKARDSNAERATLIQWFDNVQSFLVRLKLDHMDLIGTRYSLDDVYAHAIKVYGKRIIKYVRRIQETDEQGNKHYIFPEEFDDDAVFALKQNLKVWSAQYVNDPIEGLSEFKPDWLQRYYWLNRDRISAFTGTTVAAPTTINIRDLDIIIIVDPAVTGKTGIVVPGVDARGRIFMLDAIKGRFQPAQLVQELFRLVTKWQPRCTYIEEVVFSAVYRPWIEREQQIRNFRFPIIGVKPERVANKNSRSVPESKLDRVRGLEPFASAKQIYCNEGQAEFIEEWTNFGATSDYHMLDALAYGPKLWRNGATQRQLEKYKQLEEELLNDRDVLTGYSR